MNKKILFRKRASSKFYKVNTSYNSNMFPVILFGSLDEFYSGFGGGLNE